jgi:lipopolysaccharide/colanic/teichoic acid biosynthesis glycosyltransferase
LPGLVDEWLLPQQIIRRGLDLVLASLLLIAIRPIWMAIAVSIAFRSGLPVFFKRKPVRKGGRPFTMLEFRTMRKIANRLLWGAHADQTVPCFKVEGDPRLTKIGDFLRRVNLDELLQLLNVLRRDLNLVGPHLLALEQVEANRELLAAPHAVLAGMKGGGR